MRRVRLTVVLVLAAGLMGGCGGEDGEPATGGTSGSAASATQAAPEEAGAASPDSTERPDTDGDGSPDVASFEAALGDGLTLVGQPAFEKPAGDAVRMTVLEVIGPFKGFNLDEGRELIGVKVRFEGAGDEVYDSPQPHAELTLAGGEKGEQTSLITGSGKNPCDNKSLKLQKGDKVNSCLAFEVPKGVAPQQLKYVAGSGYGDTGVWTLE